MKTLASLLLCALMLNASALSLTNTINPNYTLTWKNDTNFLDDSTVFRTYQSTNVSGPWNLVTNVCITNFYPLQIEQVIGTNIVNGNPVYNTNYLATNFSVIVTADIWRDFWFATSSNALRGESFMSDYKMLPPASPAITNLTIQKAP